MTHFIIEYFSTHSLLTNEEMTVEKKKVKNFCLPKVFKNTYTDKLSGLPKIYDQFVVFVELINFISF